MAWLRTRADYEKLGVEPPENIDHGEINIQPDNHPHKWVQVGSFLECMEGQHPHGIPFDHMNKVLVGVHPSGEPILKDIELQELDSEKRKSHTKI